MQGKVQRQNQLDSFFLGSKWKGKKKGEKEEAREEGTLEGTV